jgi:hypothetical protein
MTSPVRYHRRAVLLLAALASTLQAACVTPTSLTGGSIPPSAFEFHNTIPYTGPGTGGWKVAQVHILLARLSPLLPEAAWCDVEVGVPEVNVDGPVLDASARIESAVAANLSARSTLGERLPTAILCANFITQMHKNLQVPIKGSKVSRFSAVGVPRTRHPSDE